MSDEAPVVDPPETPEAPERPAWLPENFESPEALAASYKEAQAAITRESQRAAEAERRAAELEAMAQQAPQVSSDDYEQQLQDAFEANPVATMAWLAQQAAADAIAKAAPKNTGNQHEIVAYAADQALSAQYDDWNDYKSKVAQAIQADPRLLQVDDSTPLSEVQRGLERVYKFVKAEDVLAQTGQQSEQAAEAMRQAKNQAQTAGGGSGRPPVASDDEAHFNSLLEAAKGLGYASGM